MPKQCMVSGKKPKKTNKISFSHKKHRYQQEPNLQWKRFWVEDENRFVRLRVTARVIKQVSRMGLKAALKKNGTTLEAVASR